MAALRDRLQARLLAALPHARVNGPDNDAQRLPNTLSLGVPGVHAAGVLAAVGGLVAASAGSACHAGSASPVKISAVLAAMGVPVDVAAGTFRLSVGPDATVRQVDDAADVLLHEIAAAAAAAGKGASGCHQ